MKKFLKFLKYSFFAFILLIVLGLATIYVGHKLIFPIPYSDVTTIPDIKAGDFCLGVNCQDSPKTVNEFIPVFANQIKNYNAIAPSLWPENKVVSMYVIVESIENDVAWLISPQGEVSPLTSTDLREIVPVRARYNIGFTPFETDRMQGTYLALSEETLKNVLEYETYQYLGTYDLLLTFNHEMFHQLEQDEHWASPEHISNRSRDPMLENTAARTARYQLYQLLLEAYATRDTDQKETMIKQVLANYAHYKKTYPEDFEAAKYYDRIEGTAHYYEVISSLYSAYPEQVYSAETLREALHVLALSDHPKPYEDPGVDSESYILGAWTGFLLDALQEDPTQWKKDLMHHGDTTPLDILAQEFEGKSLPEPVAPSEALEAQVKAAIQKKQDKSVAPGIFRMLYQLIF